MNKKTEILQAVIFFQALVATLGSLYFSEVMKFPPCVLCWYQRICMYPLVIIAGVGIFTKDRRFINYILPLAGIGWTIAFYHNLLYYKLLPESIKPCAVGVSCTTKFFAWFGFITIPLMSFVAFSVILAAGFLFKRYIKKQ